MADLGDPIGRKSRSKGRPKRHSVARAAAQQKTRTRAQLVDEIDTDRLEQAHERRNARGIDGIEPTVKCFIVDYRVLLGELARVKGKIATRLKQAKHEGVPVKLVKPLFKELGKESDAQVLDLNTMNQLRGIVDLAHSAPIELPSMVRNESARNELAYRAGRQHVWRGGSESDNPYAEDQERGQSWLKGYRDAWQDAAQASSQAAVKRMIDATHQS